LPASIEIIGISCVDQEWVFEPKLLDLTAMKLDPQFVA